MKSTQEITQEVRELGQWIPALRQQVGHVVVGQKYLVDRLLLGLLANGHLLLEGVPGLAKTLTVKPFARRFDRHTHLQAAHRRIYDEARAAFFELNSGGRNQSRASKSAERVARSDAGTAGHHR